MVNGPFVIEGSHHEPKGVHADAVVVEHEAHSAKVEGLGRQEVRKTAAKGVRTGARQVTYHGVVVCVQRNGAHRHHVNEEVGPREKHEKMRPEVDHVIVEYERVPEVVQERTTIEPVSSSNEGFPEKGGYTVPSQNSQRASFICVSFKRDGLPFVSSIGQCTSDEVVSLPHPGIDQGTPANSLSRAGAGDELRGNPLSIFLEKWRRSFEHLISDCLMCVCATACHHVWSNSSRKTGK